MKWLNPISEWKNFVALCSLMRTLKTARSFSNGRIRVYCEIFPSPRLTLKSVVKRLEKDLRGCSPRACAVPFSVPHRLTATDGQESEWCTQTKNTGTNEQIYLPGHTQENFETAQALLCVRIMWVCGAHKTPIWIFACVFFFFLKGMFSYRFHKWKQQTSSFIALFWSPLPFPSSPSGQVRLDSKWAPK